MIAIRSIFDLGDGICLGGAITRHANRPCWTSAMAMMCERARERRKKSSTTVTTWTKDPQVLSQQPRPISRLRAPILLTSTGARWRYPDGLRVVQVGFMRRTRTRRGLLIRQPGFGGTWFRQISGCILPCPSCTRSTSARCAAMELDRPWNYYRAWEYGDSEMRRIRRRIQQHPRAGVTIMPITLRALPPSRADGPTGRHGAAQAMLATDDHHADGRKRCGLGRSEVVSTFPDSPMAERASAASRRACDENQWCSDPR
ncbi:hypothetical protein J3F84DRAFT_373492 [Trichoderma pleuroticola]